MTAQPVLRPDETYHPHLLRLFDYWNEKRGDRPMPKRSDIDPVDLRFAMGDMTLIDVERDPLRFRVRLEGTNAVSRSRVDMTGRYVDQLPMAEYRSQLIESYTRIAEERRPDWAKRSITLDQRPYAYEVLWLPLSEDGGTVGMILVYVVYV
jgi:hypothetical protein